MRYAMLIGIILLYAQSGEALALSFECPEIPYAEGDISQAMTAAREVLSGDLSKTAFDSTEVSKCATSYTLPTGIAIRMETLTFVGLFSERSTESDVSLSDAVTCRITTTLSDDAIQSIAKTCTLGQRTLVRFNGVSNLIEVDSAIPINVARQYLELLASKVNSVMDGETLKNDEFSDISKISGFGIGLDSWIVLATYQTGCYTHSFKAKVTSGSTLQFSDLERSGSVC